MITPQEVDEIGNLIEQRLNKTYIMTKKKKDVLSIKKEYTSNQDFVNIVIDVVCYTLAFERDEVCSKSRKAPFPDIRKIIFKLSKDYGSYSLTFAQIGSFFANSDHATVMWGIRKAKDLYSTDRQFKKEYDACEEKLTEVININLKNQNND